MLYENVYVNLVVNTNVCVCVWSTWCTVQGYRWLTVTTLCCKIETFCEKSNVFDDTKSRLLCV